MELSVEKRGIKDSPEEERGGGGGEGGIKIVFLSCALWKIDL